MEEKFIVVTGAEGGIGKATSKLFIDNGFNVFGLDRQHSDDIDFPADNYFPINININEGSDIKNAVSFIKSQTAEILGLINIAGVFDQFPLAEVDEDRFLHLIQTNFISQQNITRAILPLLNRKHGRIINLSSETVLSPMPLQAYAFSKKLFEVWNDQLRIELALLGLNVVKIRAGGHQTPFINHSINVLSNINEKSIYRNLESKIKYNGLKMLNTINHHPSDVAGCILKALLAKNPKKTYHINISTLFRILSILPPRLTEKIMISKLKGWM